MIRHTVSTIFN